LGENQESLLSYVVYGRGYTICRSLKVQILHSENSPLVRYRRTPYSVEVSNESESKSLSWIFSGNIQIFSFAPGLGVLQ
jgi:hypothetical protein